MRDIIKILFIEDDDDYREAVTELLESYSYRVTTACNGQIALEHIYMSCFDLYLVDYDMPIINGEQFVTRLKLKEPNSVVIMLTGSKEITRVVRLMKLGIFDYLIKPSSVETIQKTISSAIEFKKTLQEQYERQLQTAKEIQSRVLWNEYKKNATENTTAVTKEVLENMRRNLLQGSGIGAQISLINLIDMVKGQADAEGNYKISAEMIDLLVSNNASNQKQLATLTNTLAILSAKSFSLSPVNISEFLTNYMYTIKLLKIVLEKNKQSIIRLEPIKHDAILNINTDYFSLAIEEILTNAAKYSSKGSKINIYTYIKDGFYFIAVRNSINSEEEGVPAKYETLVTEPFFRLSKESEEAYIDYDEKYSTGLGLCVVSHIAKQHQGLFWIKNHKDHLNSTSGLSAIAEIGLPIQVPV